MGAKWHVQCGMMGMRKERVSLQHAQCKDSKLRREEGSLKKKKKTVNDEWPHSSLSALMLELLYQFTLFHKKGLAVSVLS